MLEPQRNFSTYAFVVHFVAFIRIFCVIAFSFERICKGRTFLVRTIC